MSRIYSDGSYSSTISSKTSMTSFGSLKYLHDFTLLLPAGVPLPSERTVLENMISFFTHNQLEDFNEELETHFWPETQMDYSIKASIEYLQQLRSQIHALSLNRFAMTSELERLVREASSHAHDTCFRIYRAWQNDRDRLLLLHQRNMVLAKKQHPSCIARFLKKTTLRIEKEYKQQLQLAQKKRDYRLAQMNKANEKLDMQRSILSLGISELIWHRQFVRNDGSSRGNIFFHTIHPNSIRKISHGVYEYTLSWAPLSGATAVPTRVVVRRDQHGRFDDNITITWRNQHPIPSLTTFKAIVWDQGIQEDREQEEFGLNLMVERHLSKEDLTAKKKQDAECDAKRLAWDL